MDIQDPQGFRRGGLHCASSDCIGPLYSPGTLQFLCLHRHGYQTLIYGLERNGYRLYDDHRVAPWHRVAVEAECRLGRLLEGWHEGSSERRRCGGDGHWRDLDIPN